MTRLVFDPWIPWALWMPLAVATVAIWCAYAVVCRRRLLEGQRLLILTLMGVAVAVPLILLLNPTWLRELPPPEGKPLLTLLVDRSLSMATLEGPQNESRLEIARRIATATSQELQNQFDVEIKTFAEAPVVSSVENLKSLAAAGDVSDLALAVSSSLVDRPRGQAIWMLSDGAHNAAGSVHQLRQAAEQARTVAVPIYCTPVGGPTGVRDLEVSLPMPQEIAFVGQTVLVNVTINQRGQVSDRATVRLLLDGEVVDERQVGLTPDTATETAFRVLQPKTGLFRYEVVVAAMPNEVTDLNNSASLIFRVIDEPVRVLLLEGKPYWDTKFLVRTLALDPSIELHTVIRMTSDRYLIRKMARPQINKDQVSAQPNDSTQAAQAKPLDKEASKLATEPTPSERDDAWEIAHGDQNWLDDPQRLGKFQIVILGRDAEAFVTDSALVELKKWLRQGEGSLVCFRGPPASQITNRLAELLPVKWTRQNESRFQVQLTSAGQSLRWFSDPSGDSILSAMPSLARTALPDSPKPLAVVLASDAAAGKTSNGEGIPVITFQPYGGGRVVVVEGAGMWRWAILPPSERDDDQLYGELWRSMMRWLVANVGLLPTQRASLRADKTAFGIHEQSTATLLVRDARDFGQTPRIWLRRADGEATAYGVIPAGEELHQFRANFGKLAEGRYSATLEGARSDEIAATTAFDVVGNLKERLDVAARPDLLQLLADGSGGGMVAGQKPADLLEKFEQHLSATQPHRVQRTVAWDRSWVLAGLLLLWGLNWTIRRRGGLV